MYNKYCIVNVFKTMKKRREHDSIGVINVPGDKYWGASTERSKIVPNNLFIYTKQSPNNAKITPKWTQI